MSQRENVEALPPLERYEVMKELHGPLLVLWKAVECGSYRAIDSALAELDRRAAASIHDNLNP